MKTNPMPTKPNEEGKHTPTPWIADGYHVKSKCGKFVHDHSGARFVSRMALMVDATTHEGIEESERNANAALIVKCVNEHSALEAVAEAASSYVMAVHNRESARSKYGRDTSFETLHNMKRKELIDALSSLTQIRGSK